MWGSMEDFFLLTKLSNLRRRSVHTGQGSAIPVAPTALLQAPSLGMGDSRLSLHHGSVSDKEQ